MLFPLFGGVIPGNCKLTVTYWELDGCLRLVPERFAHLPTESYLHFPPDSLYPQHLQLPPADPFRDFELTLGGFPRQRQRYCFALGMCLFEGSHSDRAVENHYSLQHFLLDPEVLKDRRKGGHFLIPELGIHQERRVLAVTSNPSKEKRVRSQCLDLLSMTYSLDILWQQKKLEHKVIGM